MENKILIEFVVIPKTNEVTFKYSGYDEQKLNYKDLHLFNINDSKLKNAVNQVLDLKSAKHPSSIRLMKPAMWNSEDMFVKCNAKPVTRVTSVKSIEFISYVKKPLALSSQTFRNESSVPISVNTGLNHSVENTMTTAWLREHDLSIGQAFEYNVKIFVVDLKGTTTMGYSSKWGTSEEKSNSVTIGTNTGTEIELAPGQSVTAVLSANVVEIEALVTYSTSLRNRLVAIYDEKHKDNNVWSIDIRDLMNCSNISNEITFKEKMKFNYYMEGSLEVHDAKRN